MKQAGQNLTAQATLQQAVELQQSGRPEEALQLCERLLAENGRYADALHLSGLIHCQSGRLELGIERLRAGAAVKADDPVLWFNLGKALKDFKRLDEAAATYRQALGIMPDYIEARYNLGNVLYELGRPDEAAGEFSLVLQAAPEHDGASYNRAVALQKRERLDEAVEAFSHHLSIRPDHSDAHYNLAVCLHKLGRVYEALAAYGACLEIEPSNQSARHLVAALNGDLSDAPPRDYVLGLFDGYAARFEDHLVNTLGYNAPEMLRELVDGLTKGGGKDGPRHFPKALDLGCGTGLAGRHFRDIAGVFHANDLSPNMVEEARKRSKYDQVWESDIGDFLDGGESGLPCYDLILATDVFIYVGRLEAVFESVSRRCSPGGLFAFSIELLEKGDFRLLPSGRYAHSSAYIERLAAANDFKMLREKKVTLRKSERGAITGLLLVFARV